MDTTTRDEASRGVPERQEPAPAGGLTAVSVLAAATPSPVVRTRESLARTRLGYQAVERSGGPRRPGAEGGSGASLVTRRQAHLERRRRGLLYVVTAVALVCPPLWVPYLLTWLIVRSRPKHKSMRRVRGAVKALEKERFGIALQRLQEAHLLDPSNTDALYWLGLLLAEQRRYGEAAEALSIVGERVPGLPEVESALLTCYHETRAYDEAIHHAQRLLDLDPYDLDALLRLADCFAAQGDVGLAIETLQHAPLFKRTLDAPLKLVHYRLAGLYARQGDTARALQHYRRLCAADATFLDARARLAELEAGA